MRPGPSNETAEAELGSGLDSRGDEGRHHSATGEIRAELAIAAGAAALTIAFGMLAIEVLPRLG